MIEEKAKKYIEMAEDALSELSNPFNSNSFLNEVYKDIITMISSYISDAKYFYQKGDFENALAASSYAYGWIDEGVRLGILKVKEDYKKFTHYK